MKKQWLAFFGMELVGIVLILIVSCLLPQVAREHMVFFAFFTFFMGTASVFIVEIIIKKESRQQHHIFHSEITKLEEIRVELEEAVDILAWERSLYRDAMIHECDYAYVVNASENKIHDIYQEGYLNDYGFNSEGDYDEVMESVVEKMAPMILHGMKEYHLCKHYIEAYEMGERVIEVEYYVPDLNRYKRKHLFLSQNIQNMIFVFVVVHDITEKKETELEMERSLMQLAEVAESVGSGNLEVDIDINLPGPVGILADTLRQMTLNLKWHMENLNLQALKDPLT